MILFQDDLFFTYIFVSGCGEKKSSLICLWNHLIILDCNHLQGNGNIVHDITKQ